MPITTIAPPKSLKHLVKEYWFGYLGNSKAGLTSFKLIASGAPGLIFQASANQSSITKEDGSPLPICFSYGQSTGYCENWLQGNPLLCGVKFQATGLKNLLGIDASELTNQAIALEDLLPKNCFKGLPLAAGPLAIFNFLNQQFAQLSQHQTCDLVVEHCVHHIIHQTTSSNSRTLSKQFNLSQRQLQRRFKAQVGLSIETYKQVVKFQYAIKFLSQPIPLKLTDLAYQLSFSDQSHFNRVFKQFSGLTPKSFLQSTTHESPNSQPMAPYYPIRILSY